MIKLTICHEAQTVKVFRNGYSRVLIDVGLWTLERVELVLLGHIKPSGKQQWAVYVAEFCDDEEHSETGFYVLCPVRVSLRFGSFLRFGGSCN